VTHFCSKFKNKLRTIQPSAEEQSLKFSVKVANKTAASTAQFPKCMLLHAYSHTTASFQLRENKQTFIQLFNKLV